MASGGNRVFRGSYTGTGAALDIECGFKPVSVKFYNRTDVSTAWWTELMGAARGVSQKAGTTADIASEGVTQLPSGFRVGTNNVLNAAADLVFFEAAD